MSPQRLQARGRRNRLHVGERVRQGWKAFWGVSGQVLCRAINPKKRLGLMFSAILPVLAYGLGSMTMLAAELETLQVGWARP